MSVIDCSTFGTGRVRWLVGGKTISNNPLPRFDDETCAFLASLSKMLLSDPLLREYPDVASFAYWCRRQNIEKKKQQTTGNESPALANRLGQGLAFHIAPSNIPVNFAFSFVFSLLAGNANIIRVPSKPFPQIDIICTAIQDTLKEYSEIAARTAFISYASDDAITSEFSAIADVRLLWGGDATISHIQTLRHKASCKDILFFDRYSFALIDSFAVESASDAELQQLAQDFYNDTFLMDQNACSSPQTIFWLGASSEGKKRFWQTVRDFAESHYKLQGAVVIDKYCRLCAQALQRRVTESVTFDGLLTVVPIDAIALKESLIDIRGLGGLFFESDIKSVDEVAPVITDRIQTLLYFGCDPNEIRGMVIEKRLRGVDRIVPIGSAMDIDIIWDGYDLVNILSRIVDVR